MSGAPPAIDADNVDTAVRSLLHEPHATVTSWQARPMGWMNIMASDLLRLDGTASIPARDGLESVEWSLALKVLRPPPNDESGPAMGSQHPSDWNYWCTEALLYQSGVLDKLEGDLRAPGCAAVTSAADGALQIWLEFVRDTEPGKWTLERHALAARHLGVMNGLQRMREPQASEKLRRTWLRSWVAFHSGMVTRLAADGLWDRPDVLTVIRRPERVTALQSKAEILLRGIERLPQAFSHLDAWRQNLIADGSRTVAIDWMFSGIAAVGEEAAGAIGGDLWDFEVGPEQASELEDAIFSGYVDGLHEAGWHGHDRHVRFGYAAALALRYGVLIPVWASFLHDEDSREWVEKKFGRTVDAVAHGWAEVLEFVLARADEADKLGTSIGLL